MCKKKTLPKVLDEWGLRQSMLLSFLLLQMEERGGEMAGERTWSERGRG
jgi:hypothetical protein